jgi:hypothetical protein
MNIVSVVIKAKFCTEKGYFEGFGAVGRPSSPNFYFWSFDVWMMRAYQLISYRMKPMFINSQVNLFKRLRLLSGVYTVPFYGVHTVYGICL